MKSSETVPATADAAGEPSKAPPAGLPRARGVRRVSIAVLVVGLLVTLVLALGAWKLHDSNEDRLLRQRAHEAATVASAAVPVTQVPLTSSAVLAEATDGDTRAFTRLMQPIVAARQPFVSASLWPVGTQDPRPLTVVGAPPELATESPEQIRAVLERAAESSTLAINDLLGGTQRRLGYALVAPGASPRYAVYAEAALPKSRQARIGRNSAFADFDYALYVGTQPRPGALLASSTGGAVLTGRTARDVVPFGDSKILLVLSPRGELGGTLLARLPWLLGAFGLGFTLAAALLVERLARRRSEAEQLALRLLELAQDNARLYEGQHQIAQTLQRSLLPERLPVVAGVSAVGRYQAGVAGIDVGGDWYDALPVGPDQLLFSVGDISGRGLAAAALMASLRYSIRAYGVEGNQPSQILDKLARLIDVGRDEHFATVACGVLDTARRELTVGSAGHLQLLLIDPTGTRFVEAPVGLPIGVDPDAVYETITVPLPPTGALLAYTDGLIERRGESIEVGLTRLRESAARVSDEPLEVLVARVVDELTTDGGDDDVAVLGLSWRALVAQAVA